MTSAPMSRALNLGNRGNGVKLASSRNTIGGTSGDAGNTIEFNGPGQSGSGVLLVGDVNENEILSNSIYENAGLGINLGDGPTSNHAPGTTGPNDYQNYPTLTLVQSDGSSTLVQGNLASIPNTAFVIQVFASPTEDGLGFGQGKNLIASFTELTDDDGNVAFSVPVAVGTAAGQYVAATATDPVGNTSEFCEDVVAQGQIKLVVSAAANPSPVLAGNDLTYNVTVTNQGNETAQFVIVHRPASLKHLAGIDSPQSRRCAAAEWPRGRRQPGKHPRPGHGDGDHRRPDERKF